VPLTAARSAGRSPGSLPWKIHRSCSGNFRERLNRHPEGLGENGGRGMGKPVRHQKGVELTGSAVVECCRCRSEAEIQPRGTGCDGLTLRTRIGDARRVFGVDRSLRRLVRVAEGAGRAVVAVIIAPAADAAIISRRDKMSLFLAMAGDRAASAARHFVAVIAA
jgi:hypothetical protein